MPTRVTAVSWDPSFAAMSAAFLARADLASPAFPPESWSALSDDERGAEAADGGARKLAVGPGRAGHAAEVVYHAQLVAHRLRVHAQLVQIKV